MIGATSPFRVRVEKSADCETVGGDAGHQVGMTMYLILFPDSSRRQLLFISEWFRHKATRKLIARDLRKARNDARAMVMEMRP